MSDAGAKFSTDTLVIGSAVLLFVIIVGFFVVSRFNVKGKNNGDGGGGAGATLSSPPRVVPKSSDATPAEQTAAAVSKGYKVTFLDTDKLDELEKSDNSAMILYYADWCGGCTAALPAFLEASRLGGSYPYYAIESRHIPPKHRHVTSYPTVHRYNHGDSGRTPHSYSGPRTAAGYSRFSSHGHH
jgi:thiol-disulfide isomerase/thioredoxin